ncbi:UDP-N-acetylmuramoyl-tripeptide--D-alanyl-D-alanine ligase [Fulvivirga sediminis]|uniref:UDP-N-acetylmuramoyl-tripeptide--D-alanyl-D-alanine ligase n=1 Tax=Fulvivirga sediminis TaxID=2803949 RepID=A0A937FAM8_9BACT|nr:UDP-N-acetylmuramoyl-tripeptide--D-alanyl-D-alanine ligase [Fulvivirga sediminis]MBL3657088.1 UDP-N-acetylmuramoyl-tripeptide--D-alanyl-D-alanine ligase [Fulvivirga sediminis]
MEELEAIYNVYLKSGRVSTDTRKIQEGDVFFALKGENFDANKFAADSLSKGASLAVIDNKDYKADERYIVVEDTLKALQSLALHHRSQLSIPIIGLTGSNGKTTTKELINAVLSRKYKTLATSGNLNNHIGVPLTLLNIDSSHEIAIIEMGANHIGEIAALCEIAQPTHGLITNIGKAHLEGFGGFEGVIRAKSELYHYLIKTNGTVWINSNNDILTNMSKRFESPLFYPSEGDYYHCEFKEASPYVTLVAENKEELITQLIGKYNFENIAIALCIGKFFKVDENIANTAVCEYSPSNNRSQVIKKNSNTIILDAYNANPSSMASAIENLFLMKTQKKIIILGDMKELGPESDLEHEKLGATLSEKQFTDIYLCGELIQPALKHVPEANYFTSRKELIEALKETEFSDSVILIKASRSLGLEEIVEYL